MPKFFRGTPHPALSVSRISSEMAAIPRRKRERDFVRVAAGLWLPTGHPADFESMSVAFSRLYPDGVLTGWSAAVIHRISPPDDAIPELCVKTNNRKRRGLRIRRYPMPESEVEVRGGVRVTSRRQTAFDLARFNEHLDGVLAVEQFYRNGFPQSELQKVVDSNGGSWGVARVRKVLADAHPKSESPRETETRLFLREAGFTAFVPQLKLPTLGYRLDLADPSAKIAVEYDGMHHNDPVQQSKDRVRRNRLQAAGWIIIVVDYRIFQNRRDELLRQVRGAYERRAFEAAG